MKTHFSSFVLATLTLVSLSHHLDADDLVVRAKLAPEDRLETSVQSVAFSPDGAYLIAACNVRVGATPYISKRSGQGGTMKGHIALWDVAKKQKVRTIDCGGNAKYVAFSPDGKLVFFVHYETERGDIIRILDTNTWKERSSWACKKKDSFRSTSAIACSPNGKRLVVGTTGLFGQKQKIIILDPETGKEKSSLEGGEVSVSSLSFSSDGKLLVSICEDVVQVWDMTTEKQRDSFAVGRGSHAAISPDGSTIAVSTSGSRNYSGKVALTLCDPRTGKEQIDFKCLHSVSAILFTPDGKKLIYGIGKGIIQVVDTKTGKTLATTDGPTHTSMAITCKGNLLATGHYSGTIWLWDLEGKK